MQTSAVSPVVLFGRIISPPKLEPSDNGGDLKRKLTLDEKPSHASPDSAKAAENGSLSSQESVVTAENSSFHVQETTNNENTSNKRLQTQESLENPSVSAPSVSNEASKRKDIEFSMVNSQANDEVATFQSGKRMRCPRCDSYETKFCYFNNYNVKQPRHFCRNCQRYWTAGGSLRNVPVGAGRRRNKTGNNTKQTSSEERIEIQSTDHNNSGLCNTRTNNLYMASSSSSSPSTSGYNSSSLQSLSSTTVTSGSRYNISPLPSSTSPSFSVHCSSSVSCTSTSTCLPAQSSSSTPHASTSTKLNHVSPAALLHPKLEETSTSLIVGSSSSSCSTIPSVSQPYFGISPQSITPVGVQSSVGVPLMWPLPWSCQVSSPSPPGGVFVWPYQAWPPNPNPSHLPSVNSIPQISANTPKKFPLPPQHQYQLHPSLPPPLPPSSQQQHPKSHNLHQHNQAPNSPSSVSAFQPFNSNTTLYQPKQQQQLHHKQQVFQEGH